jgi:hypothetical protein
MPLIFAVDEKVGFVDFFIFIIFRIISGVGFVVRAHSAPLE